MHRQNVQPKTPKSEIGEKQLFAERQKKSTRRSKINTIPRYVHNLKTLVIQ